MSVVNITRVWHWITCSSWLACPLKSLENFCVSVEDLLVSNNYGTSPNHLTLTVDNRNHLVFSLDTCGEVSLALSQIPGLMVYKTYLVVIGSGANNDAIEIYSDGEVKYHQHFPCISECRHYRTFWVSWENGLINVGRGILMNVNLLASWQDTSPHLVGAVSLGGNPSAYWRFYPFRGNLPWCINSCWIVNSQIIFEFNHFCSELNSPWKAVSCPQCGLGWMHRWGHHSHPPLLFPPYPWFIKPVQI